MIKYKSAFWKLILQIFLENGQKCSIIIFYYKFERYNPAIFMTGMNSDASPPHWKNASILCTQNLFEVIMTI
jgi:hypothetical protein